MECFANKEDKKSLWLVSNITIIIIMIIIIVVIIIVIIIIIRVWKYTGMVMLTREDVVNRKLHHVLYSRSCSNESNQVCAPTRFSGKIIALNCRFVIVVAV